MDIIRHGIPKHDFFCIVQPYNKDKHNVLFNPTMSKDWSYPEIKLEDPLSKEKFKVQVHDIWSFPVDNMPNMFTQLTYGKPADYLKNILLKRYPALSLPDAKVEYWLLKKM